METIFSHVEADIAYDLVGRFPHEFDFDAMLRKVCEDSGVIVLVHKTDAKGKTEFKYKLQGLWLSMEKAYKQLLTTLMLYGSQLPEVFCDQKPESNSKEEHYTASIITENSRLEEEGRDDQGTVTNILRDVLESSLHSYQNSRKSRRHRRKIKMEDMFEYKELDDVQDSDDGIERLPTHASASQESIVKNDLENVESITSEFPGNKTDVENKSVEKESLGKEPRRRGRPRKNSSPFHITVKKIIKKRNAFKNKKVVIPVKSIDSGDSVRKRGRPKVYADQRVAEFQCSDCSFVAHHLVKLRSHRLRMHMSSPTVCDICMKVFPNKRYMQRHRASHVEPQHCCDVCGKMYKIRKAMVEHRKTHDTSFKKTKVECEHCSKTFCNRYILECHIKEIHLGQRKSYLCSTCGKSFTTKHSLAEHTNAHTGIKPHVCEHCGKSFSYESALRDHKYTHVDVKNFWCTHCQKGFSQRSGLKMHMRIHRQHKMFVCSECNRGFTQKQALQRHERVHNGEKPFVCKHCGRLFTDASIVRRHLILVHKIHKDAYSWREDIICTVKNQDEYQLQGLDEDALGPEAEKEKQLILKQTSAQPRFFKVPSRAFSRTYPRRVALLDDEGNVIAPPEVSTNLPGQHEHVNETSKVTGRSKNSITSSAANPSMNQGSENGSDLDSNSPALNSRFAETQQWESLGGHLSRGDTAHADHVILGDSVQHEAQRGMTNDQGLKIVRYDNLQAAGMDASTGHSVLSNSQSSQSSSPISFTNQPSSHTRVLDTSFDCVSPQAPHSGSQFYDSRPSANSWPSVFYYSQLASQFGMTLNPEYPCVGGTTAGVPVTPHLSQYTHSNNQTNQATLILQTQAHNIHIDGCLSEGLKTMVQCSSGNMHPTSGHSLGASNQGLKHDAKETLHQEVFLTHNSAAPHSLVDVSHHNSGIEHIVSSLGESELMMRPIGTHASTTVHRPSPSIPPRNAVLHSLKHK